MSLPLLKVVVFFVYVLKWSLLGVPKKVGPRPDWSQRFNSKFQLSISAPFIWEPKPNNFSPLLFLYGKCILSFRIPHNALCLFPPPTPSSTLPFLCINYCRQMLQGGCLTPESIEKQSVIQNLRQTDLECIMVDLHGAKMRI